MAEKILIVDDDPQTVKYLSIFIKRLGYEPLEALDGMQALKLCLERGHARNTGKPVSRCAGPIHGRPRHLQAAVDERANQFGGFLNLIHREERHAGQAGSAEARRGLGERQMVAPSQRQQVQRGKPGDRYGARHRRDGPDLRAGVVN